MGETRSYNWDMLHKAAKLSVRTNGSALNHIGGHSENTIIIGDNMRTDIQAGLETILVTSGVSSLAYIDKEPFRPNHILDCAGDIDVI